MSSNGFLVAFETAARIWGMLFGVLGKILHAEPVATDLAFVTEGRLPGQLEAGNIPGAV